MAKAQDRQLFRFHLEMGTGGLAFLGREAARGLSGWVVMGGRKREGLIRREVLLQCILTPQFRVVGCL